MRISTSQIYSSATQSMMQGQARLAEIQSKISSGKNANSLAEDPVAANQIVTLKRELSQLEMFGTNIDSTRRRLAIEDTTLADLNNAMDRMRELTIQSSNAAMSDAERRGIAYEIEELVNFSANLMNTRDAKGEYIFSGSKGTTPTYAVGSDGYYSYNGDSTQRQIQVASTQYVDSTDTGQFLFQSVTRSPSLDVLNANGVDNADISIVVSDTQVFTEFMQSTGDLQLSIVTGTANDEIVVRDSAGNIVQSFESTSPFTLNLPGADVQVTGVAGESATLRLSQPPSNILNAAIDLAEALRTKSESNPAEQPDLYAAQEQMLLDLDQAQINMSTSRASIGSRLNAVENAETSNLDFKLLTESTLSSVEDLDYAAASTELARRQLGLEASFASFAKIQGLSLFNYIN